MRRDWHSLLEGVRNREGEFKHIITSDMTVYIEPSSVEARYVSAFEKGELREIFWLRRSNERLVIVSYETETKETSNLIRQTCPIVHSEARGFQMVLAQGNQPAALAVGLSTDLFCQQ
jgi:hypothetical protein